MDYWNAPEWLIGGVGFLFLLGWITIITSMVRQKHIDVFEEPKEEPEEGVKKSKFQEKLDDAMRKGQEANSTIRRK